MSFNASSYFAGAGTVVIMLALGFGAGLHMTGMVEDTSQPNKLERRAADAAESNAPVEAKPSPSPAATDAKTPAETKTIAANATSVTAPEAPQPKSIAPADPLMAPSQRMRQTFALQPSSAFKSPPSPPVQPAAQPSLPQPPAGQATVPDQPVASPGEAELEKAKLAAAAEQRKAQQRKLAAAERRRQREAQLNAVTDWVRRQPLDVYAGPRFVTRN